LLLTWAAADLFVPNVCQDEQTTSQAAGPSGQPDHDDCFCCCTHTETAPIVTLTISYSVPTVVDDVCDAQLAAGVPRSVYHPPLS
jgi:hypothetical protein